MRKLYLIYFSIKTLFAVNILLNTYLNNQDIKNLIKKSFKNNIGWDFIFVIENSSYKEIVKEINYVSVLKCPSKSKSKYQ